MRIVNLVGRNKAALIMFAYLCGVALHSFFPLTPVPTVVWWGITIAVIGCVLILLNPRVSSDSPPSGPEAPSGLNGEDDNRGMEGHGSPLSCSRGRGAGVRAQRWTFILVIVFLVIGILRFDFSVPRVVQAEESQSFVGVLSDINDGLYGKQGTISPLVKGGKGDFLVPFSKGDSFDASHQNRGINPGAHITINLKSSIPLGSTVSFSCALKSITQKPDELDRRFAYRLHFSQATCTPKDLTVIKPPGWWDVRQWFIDLREWTNQRIKSVMPGEEGMLIAGMLYGERGMSQQSNTLFRNAGLTHLIAVSGSNITIVASIVFAILLGMGLWRKQAFWVTSITLLAYVTFTGFSASVARAALMGWLVLFANYIGRRPKTWHVLLVSAFALCILDPWMLAFDAGFALSFLATIGLMSWSPIVSRRLSFVPELGGLREAAATTISATLMTTPYLAFAFERISLAGLITNLMAVPLVPWAMLFGAISAVWGQFYGWQIITLPALGVAKLIFWSAHLSDFMPWLSLEMRRMNFVLLVATYLLLTWIWFKLRVKKSFSTTQACDLSVARDNF